MAAQDGSGAWKTLHGMSLPSWTHCGCFAAFERPLKARGKVPGRASACEALTPPTSLCVLKEDALLLALERCGAAALAALAASCSSFSRPAQLSDAGEALSLPELAAKAALQGHFESGAARPYERGAAETHRAVLALYEAALLKPGVLHDVPVAAVEGTGWRCAYKQPYRHRTCDADLEDAVPAEARYVLLGAVPTAGPRAARFGRSAAPAFALLAWGRRGTVLKATHSERDFAGGATVSENLESGVHWYRWPAHAVGFSTDPSLFLYYADSGFVRGIPEAAPGDRLSWNLETQSSGGWRAGLACDLGDSDDWLKCCYYCL